jgi:hypothetical protein
MLNRCVSDEPVSHAIFFSYVMHVMPLITESNAQICKRWCHDPKTRTSENWKHRRDMVRSQMSLCPSRCSLYQAEFTFGEHPIGKPGSNSETQHGGGYVMVWVAISRWYPVGLITTLNDQITVRKYMDKVG